MVQDEVMRLVRWRWGGGHGSRDGNDNNSSNVSS